MTSAGLAPPLLAALAALGPRIPPERIDRVWLFPSRTVGAAECSLALLSLFAADDPLGRREIVTLHCTALTERGTTQRSDELEEHGSTPADRVDRLVAGVLKRLKDGREIPHAEQLNGDRERWRALIGEPSGAG